MSGLHVREWGNGGTPILFWHALGHGASGASISTVAPVLAGRGFPVVALDGPGFGDSPLREAERYAIGALARDVLDLADERGIGELVLMGHSWGGSVAAAAAASAPGRTRALVLVDSGHIDYGSLPDVQRQTVDEWVRQAESRGHEGDRARATGAAMWGLSEQPVSEYWPVIAAEQIPTLLLLATAEPHVVQNREHVGRFSSAVPEAEVRWVPNAGHSLLDDVGAPLGDEIADWLESVGV